MSTFRGLMTTPMKTLPELEEPETYGLFTEPVVILTKTSVQEKIRRIWGSTSGELHQV